MLICQPVSWLVGWLVGWLAGWLVGKLIYQLFLFVSTSKLPAKLLRVTDNAVAAMILAHDSEVTSRNRACLYPQYLAVVLSLAGRAEMSPTGQ
jgi:hypothetical protein